MAALRWAIQESEAELSLRLARALWRFRWLHGHLSEGMDALEAVLALSHDGSMSVLELRAAVLNGAGVIAHVRGEYEWAEHLLEMSLELARGGDQKSAMAAALHNLAALARERGDWSRAAELHEQSLALRCKLGDRGVVRPGASGRALGRLAACRAAVQGESGHLRRAGVRQPIAGCLEGLAAVLSAARRPHDAARLLGAAEALREEVNSPLPARERQDLARTVERLLGMNTRAQVAAWSADRRQTLQSLH